MIWTAEEGQPKSSTGRGSAASCWCYDLFMAGNPASEKDRTASGFGGRTVLSFESRRSTEIATLIEKFGGRAVVAPATREVPATGGSDVARFASALLEEKLDLVIFL